jgi:AAA15 family ATPase/GTPase
MHISTFQFENKSLNWRLETLELNKLTLLVGASGVGKTQILKALMGLKRIAKGASLHARSWAVTFETSDKKHYRWEGEFENTAINFFDDDEMYELTKQENKSNPNIIFEKLYLNGDLIVDRIGKKILFNGQQTIKLSQQESILSLLREEDLVQSAHDDFDHTHSLSVQDNIAFTFSNAHSLIEKYNSLAKIQSSELNTLLKLFFISRVDQAIFTLIKDQFCTIFPQVEDLKVAPLETMQQDMSKPFNHYPFVQIKEEGVKHWIEQGRISSGMFRTLMQLSELYLCAEGTVFLIDEFENSLGINCINEITQYILNSDRQLQFVLTSHHPYIIDAIGMQNWKLVTRNAGIVKAHNISEFNIGKSRHSAFMQLLQLDEYQTGQM